MTHLHAPPTSGVHFRQHCLHQGNDAVRGEVPLPARILQLLLHLLPHLAKELEQCVLGLQADALLGSNSITDLAQFELDGLSQLLTLLDAVLASLLDIGVEATDLVADSLRVPLRLPLHLRLLCEVAVHQGHFLVREALQLRLHGMAVLPLAEDPPGDVLAYPTHLHGDLLVQVLECSTVDPESIAKPRGSVCKLLVLALLQELHPGDAIVLVLHQVLHLCALCARLGLREAEAHHCAAVRPHTPTSTRKAASGAAMVQWPAT
mmetsp:Transcript_30569/g.95246  ORF Transcript_30569/g.95246 Transcript_30569/m.95246 type:complete len:263 (-) Transcript_30569:4-792(-)